VLLFTLLVGVALLPCSSGGYARWLLIRPGKFIEIK